MGASYPAGLTSVYGETLNIKRILTSLGMPGFETKQALIKCPDSDFRLHLNPSIDAVLFYDASNDAGARYEKALTRDLTDRTPGGTGTAMDAAATGDRLYVCFARPVGGFRVEMKTRNGNSSVLTVNYWNGSAWTDTVAQDDTSKQGKVFNQDGDITFDKKTDWQGSHLGGPVLTGSVQGMGITDRDAPGTYGFWLQLLWSGALAADVEIANIWAINEDLATKHSAHGYFEGGREYEFSFDRRNVGAIQAFLDEDEEAELIITWLRTTKE